MQEQRKEQLGRVQESDYYEDFGEAEEGVGDSVLKELLVLANGEVGRVGALCFGRDAVQLVCRYRYHTRIPAAR